MRQPVLEKGKEQTKNHDVEIGIVIPIYQAKYISHTIRKITSAGASRKVVICIVNDGVPELVTFLKQHAWPENVIILNLPDNKQFAAANNAGWTYLKSRFPSLKYLGTLNDDTLPRKGWLDALVDALEKHPRTALVGPIMETSEGWLGTLKSFAVLKFNHDTSASWIKNRIVEDEVVPLTGGFCFLALREALTDVGGFDERFKNSCEDVDLCLNLRKNNWQILVAARSRVFHFAGKSRYLSGTKTDLDSSHLLLAEKWGSDLSCYNAIS
jgi:N-acetylglucosaminyl-diphospho-decaprenol L-rhamnosyltransferase